MKKFTDIGQFGSIVGTIRSHTDYKGRDENGEAIYLHNSDYPTIRFRGTVKNHGTNAAIALYSDGSYKFQSRERELSIGEDNAGFMTAMSGKNYKKLFEGIEFRDSVIIYGEWIGKGVQGKVAIGELSKRFIIFAVRIDEIYQDMENYQHLKIEEQDIYNILQFPHWYVDIDFNRPEFIQNKIIEMTLAVEELCPVGKYFGIEGIGEGIVFEAFYNSERYIFKSKGLKHASGNKPKILREVDEDKVNTLIDIAEQVTPVWRLDQMLTNACDLMNGGVIDRKHMGTYMHMVMADVLKEETEVIVGSGYEFKDFAKYISEIAKKYFFSREIVI